MAPEGYDAGRYDEAHYDAPAGSTDVTLAAASSGGTAVAAGLTSGRPLAASEAGGTVVTAFLNTALLTAHEAGGSTVAAALSVFQRIAAGVAGGTAVLADLVRIKPPGPANWSLVVLPVTYPGGGIVFDTPLTGILLTDRKYSNVLSDVGSGSVIVDLNQAWFGSASEAAIDEVVGQTSLFVLVNDDGPQSEFWNEQLAPVFVDPGEAQTLTVSGPGIAQCLAWATVLPDPFPPEDSPGVATILSEEMERSFTGQQALAIWLTLYNETRPLSPVFLLTPTFTATVDSNGNAWAVSPLDRKISIGNNLLSLLNELCAAVQASWYISRSLVAGVYSFKLNVVQAPAHNFAATKIFTPALNLLHNAPTVNRARILNTFYGVSDAGGGLLTLTGDVAFKEIDRFLWRETVIQIGTATGVSTAQAFVRAILNVQRGSERTIPLKVLPDAAGLVPGLDFGLSDLLAVAFGGSLVAKALFKSWTLPAFTEPPTPGTQLYTDPLPMQVISITMTLDGEYDAYEVLVAPAINT